MNISVIICTHNPRLDLLTRTLESLVLQTLDKSNWELLVIDNGSQDPVVGRFSTLEKLGARVIREEELGLTPARLRGIRESRHSLLVFIDDDNVLEPEYLERTVEIAAEHPYIAVFGAGRVYPEFEVKPPSALNRYLGWLALRELTGDYVSRDPKDGRNPFGAGMCCTRELALAYVKHIESLSISCLDRVGNMLSSGGDMEFSWLAVRRGRKKGIFERLGLKHLMPKERLTIEYFCRLAHDSAYSHVLLDAIHDLPISRSSAGFRYYFGPLKTAVHLARGNAVAARIASAKRKGYYAGCRVIRSSGRIE